VVPETGTAFFDALLARLADACRRSPREAALQEICALLHDNIPHYNWVGFYLVDPPGSRWLVLGPFVGAPTEHTRIPFGRGVCGQAAEQRQTVVVDDVSQEGNYLSCSVDVRSEIVLPLIKDGMIHGELDIDSHVPAAFTESDRSFLDCVGSLASALF
jgi:GAF domain-containing protein